ncbi:MAG: glycosyltransferase family 4 protein [Verrucomicrobiales bacterium]
MERRAIIRSDGGLDARLVARTARSLSAAGWEVVPEGDWMRLEGPALVVRSGCWLSNPAGFIPEKDEIMALGATSDPSWARLLSICGGDFGLFRRWPGRLPRIDAVYFSAEGASKLRSGVNGRTSFDEAIWRLVLRENLRAVHLPALDVHFDPAMRVLQVVTTLQIGGAESITLNLAEAHHQSGVPTAVAVLAASRRESFAPPRFFYDLTNSGTCPRERAHAIRVAALDWGADVIHAHLISAEEMRMIRSFAVPLIVTLHNMPQGWPKNYRNLGPNDADLLVACSRAVAMAAFEAGLRIPIRCAWNGIVPAKFAMPQEFETALPRAAADSPFQKHEGPPRARQYSAMNWRKHLGLGEDERLLLCLANPRPQKRLPLLPLVLRSLDDGAVRFHIAIAGGPLDHQEVVTTQEGAARAGVAERIHWLGVVTSTPALLAACDGLISVSSWEGLSVAHLEALAAGKPVVATAVGGASEIAAQHPRMYLVPRDATPSAIAEAIIRTTEAGTPAPATFPLPFTRHAMARRYRWLYRRAIASAAARAPNLRFDTMASRLPQRRDGLWLITNNFSTGGAQSSARRLLLGLQARGVNVRAAAVEESPRHPTPGRRALLEAGVRVVSIPPPASGDAAEACDMLLEHLDADPARAIVFWNLITSYKVMLADSLFDTSIFDVSPGEMYYTSLDRYFAQPPAGMPYLAPEDYGERLTGVIVKYAAEADRASRVLRSPVHVIRNGVETPAAMMIPSRRTQRLTLATAARLSPDKRLEELIDAVRLAHSRLPPYRLYIAGGIERGQKAYARELRRRASGLSITWCGELSHTRNLLAISDLFLMISEPAGCPNASLEALAAGVPVIATDVGGAPEQVLEGLTGRLVPPRDPAAFATALCDLVHDSERRRQMRLSAREHVRRGFSIEEMLDRYHELFFEGLKTGSTG